MNVLDPYTKSSVGKLYSIAYIARCSPRWTRKFCERMKKYIVDDEDNSMDKVLETVRDSTSKWK